MGAEDTGRSAADDSANQAMIATEDFTVSSSMPVLPDRPRRVLLVTYTFPPVGGAGVQRVGKLAKYLPRCGWNVSVLTAANPSVPLFDNSLLADIGEGTEVHRARTLEPGYAMKAMVAGTAAPAGKSSGSFAKAWLRGCLRRSVNFVLQPDPQILWKRDAVRVGMRVLRKTPHDVILVSAPPFSITRIGRELSRRSGLPLILDFRDEWDLSNQYWESKRLDPLSRMIHRKMQRSALRSAAAVVATTQASAEHLRDECWRSESRARVDCVFNGFDAEDFASFARTAPASSHDGLVRLTYVGTLWKLTTIEPIVRALQQIAATSPQLLAKFRLVVAGRRIPTEQALLDELKPLGPIVEEHGYLDHSIAVTKMAQADRLCVTLAGLPGAGRVLPAKVFECLAVRRPVLAIAPRGELWKVLEPFPGSKAIEPGDVAGIAAYLRALIQSGGGAATQSAAEALYAPYDRFNQARQLAEILESVAVRRD